MAFFFEAAVPRELVTGDKYEVPEDCREPYEFPTLW
jgi:hypothetical protein